MQAESNGADRGSGQGGSPGAAGGEAQLLSVSAAARLLGVSPSSLRAWAAAGRVPFVRTPGGHRRFERSELVRWLAEHGGAPPAPAPPASQPEAPPGPRAPRLADDLRAASQKIAGAFGRELEGRRPGGSGPLSAARIVRLEHTLEALAESLASGDPSESDRNAEWEGFRHGASGQAGDQAVVEVLSLRRAIERSLGNQLSSRREERRTLERLVDRMAVRVAAGHAEGVRCRLRSRA